MERSDSYLTIYFHRMVSRMDRRSAALCKQHGLTLMQFAVLEALLNKGELSVGEVKEAVLSSDGTIPVVVANLHKAGLITKQPDSSDRRRSMLALTDEGRARVRAVIPGNDALLAEELSDWSAEEKAKLIEIFRKHDIENRRRTVRTCVCRPVFCNSTSAALSMKQAASKEITLKRIAGKTVQGFRTEDGAGVSLVRVLGSATMKEFDPFIMLDSFDSTNYDDYKAGFPMHPHRGIETVSYLAEGGMVHRDSLGNEAAVGSGEVQWMCSGSGIMHEEMIPESPRLLGVQMWLNLPSGEKMCSPAYRAFTRDMIPGVELNGVWLRVLAGSFGDVQGAQAEHLPLDYYELKMEPGAHINIPTDPARSVMAFTLLGSAVIGEKQIEEKTAVKLEEGDSVDIEAGPSGAQVLFMSSIAVNEPQFWAGPIVMNTREETLRAYDELNQGTFLRTAVDYE